MNGSYIISLAPTAIVISALSGALWGSMQVERCTDVVYTESAHVICDVSSSDTGLWGKDLRLKPEVIQSGWIVGRQKRPVANHAHGILDATPHAVCLVMIALLFLVSALRRNFSPRAT